MLGALRSFVRGDANIKSKQAFAPPPEAGLGRTSSHSLSEPSVKILILRASASRHSRMALSGCPLSTYREPFPQFPSPNVGLCHELRQKHRILPAILARNVIRRGAERRIDLCNEHPRCQQSPQLTQGSTSAPSATCSASVRVWAAPPC